jgi:xanthine dehydrogenase accessory factor
MAPLAEALGRGEAAMLVHVAELKGSGPREAGAQMLVTERAATGTIGGGELEHSAMLKARELLETGRAALVRYALGPELSQCCGGSVTLAFEPFAPADLAWLDKLMRAAADPAPVFRTLRLDESGNLRRDWSAGGGRREGDFAATLAGGRLIVRERVNPPAQAVWLFGAGHVGRAVAAALHPLGFALTGSTAAPASFPTRLRRA